MNIEKEYGIEVSLQEILEQLSLYCALAGESNPRITVVLPEAALDKFSKSFIPKEVVRIPLGSHDVLDNNQSTHISRLWVNGGTIELYSDKDLESKGINL
jgi:uncharacterized protein YfaA (DUF2138 family)